MIGDRIIHSKPSITKFDNKAVLGTLNSGFVGEGEEVKKVIDFFSGLFKKDGSFFVNSGTSAFFLALKGLDIKENDEVIIPNYLCSSIYSQIKILKAIPVVIDTEADSIFVSPEIIRKAITSKTKAILINHPFGHFEQAIFELMKNKVPIIEDVTHSPFTQKGKVIAGSISDVTIASFGSTKFLTSGTGGIVSFSSKAHALSVEKLLDHDYKYFPSSTEEKRFNFKLGDLNASLLISQLNQSRTFIEKRNQIAIKYYSKLKVPMYPECFDEGAVYFRFFIRIEKSRVEGLLKHLRGNKIDVAQGAVSLINKTFSIPDSFPNSEKIWSELISIPIYPTLKSNEINRIVKVINSFS
jgi:perosamine synthetase